MDSGRPDPRLTRRALLRNSAYIAVGVTATTSLAGCSLFSTDPKNKPRTGGAKGLEAPMLAEQVKTGKLPPVAQRLPENPLVWKVTENFGVYGGTWRTAVTGPGDGPWLHRTIGNEPLLRWTRDFSGYMLNVAESLEASADGREFQVKLRKGHKWSDGQPLTTKDVQFAFDVLTDTTLNQTVHQMIRQGSNIATLQIVDDQTFVVKFPKPNGLWVLNNARGVDGDRLIGYPRHYLEKFHPKFNSQAEAEAKAAGFATWQERFTALSHQFNGLWTNKDLPSLKAWVAVDPLDDSNVAVFQRNPYFYKIDEEGSQLPYIDEVRYDTIPEQQAILLRVTNGDFHFHSRHVMSLANKPVIVENQERGKYKVLDFQGTSSNDMVINLNLHHRDPAVAAIFQKKDFRVGLSHAINRDRLISAVWQRQGEAWQPAPTKESIYYDEQMAKQFTNYDTAEANKRLDAAGLTAKDGQGFRLRPDGKPFQVRISVATNGPIAFWVQALELVAQDWKAVGVNTILDPKQRDAFETEKNERTQDCTVWLGEGGRGDEIFMPRSYMAFDFESHWGNSWAAVWRGQTFEAADAPPPAPAAVTKQQQLYDEVAGLTDPKAREAKFKEILAIAKEEFWVIGTVRSSSAYGVVSNKMHNVGGPMPDNGTWGTPAPAAAEQWYIKE